MQLDRRAIGQVTLYRIGETSLPDILSKYKGVFQDKLGTIQGFTANLTVAEGANP